MKLVLSEGRSQQHLPPAGRQQGPHGKVSTKQTVLLPRGSSHRFHSFRAGASRCVIISYLLQPQMRTSRGKPCQDLPTWKLGHERLTRNTVFYNSRNFPTLKNKQTKSRPTNQKTNKPKNPREVIPRALLFELQSPTASTRTRVCVVQGCVPADATFQKIQ